MAELEKSGVPTVAFVVTTYEPDFIASAKAFGEPDLPYVIVSDRALPLMQADEIGRRVDSVLDAVVEKLTALPVKQSAPTGETVNLATVVFGQEVSAVECFEGADHYEAWEKMNGAFLERQWGDGFPLVAPIPKAVSRMLTGTSRSPKQVVAVLEPMFGIATVEKIAINAVMAGCKPEHLPVLIAAVEAIIDPGYDLRHTLMSTGSHTPCLVVNGPIAKRIGMNSGHCTLGPGAPSAVNTAIGRAMRLILMNIAGNYVGVTDLDAIGDSNKYSMCLAENEEANPWEPLHVERGYGTNESTVTVFVAYSNIAHTDHKSTRPELFLRRLAKTLCIPGHSTTAEWLARPHNEINSWNLKPKDYEQDVLLILCPQHARMLAAGGFNKQGVKAVLHNFARVRIGDQPGSKGNVIARYGIGETQQILAEWQWLHDYPDAEIPAYYSPECIQIVVAGGDTTKSMVVVGGKKSITRKIEE